MISVSHKRFGVVLSLLVLIGAVYWPVGGFPFIGYDDDVVRNNPWFRGGLSLDGLRWAFTAPSALWDPLSWISHMADVELFGQQAGAHHLVNVVFHAAGTLVLFLALEAMTGSRGKSAFVAALFAVHPLHVESVVWIAERKDVLSGFFWMLALAAYVGYVRHPRPSRYLALCAAFALGFMAKPMLVTFPFVLLLLDYWPLGRVRLRGGMPAGGRTISPAALLAEKLPIVALAAGFAIVTVISAHRGGVIGSLEDLPLWARLVNAVISYSWYALKTVWPTSLAIVYPHPGIAIEPWAICAAVAFVGAATWFALRSHDRRPAIAVGWLWYLGTLLPAIGLVQVGAIARADRFTYLPLIGLFVVAAWGAQGLVSRLRLAGSPSLWVAGSVVLAMAAASFVQVGYWRDDETLFGHALAVTRGNWMIHGNLGATLMEKGDLEGAIVQFREALRYNHGYELARLNLGQALSSLGRDDEAEGQFQEVLRQRPGDERAHFCLGRHFAARERWDEAIRHLERAVRLNPGFAQAYVDLAGALMKAGRNDEAVNALRDAERLGVGK